MKNGDDVGTVLGEDNRACHACRPQAFGDISNSTVPAQQQAVGDPAESGEPLDTVLHERELRVPADFADAGHAVRVDVEERVPGVAAGERLAFAQLIDVV